MYACESGLVHTVLFVLECACMCVKFNKNAPKTKDLHTAFIYKSSHAHIFVFVCV